MSEWIDVIKAESLAVGEYFTLELDDVPVVVLHTDAGFFAIVDQCSHDEQPLADGNLSDATIACPAHGALFCLRTGKPLSPPAYEAVQTFATRIHDGMLQIHSQPNALAK